MRYAWDMTQIALATGCPGFIGPHLTDGLFADGLTVVGIDSLEAHESR